MEERIFQKHCDDCPFRPANVAEQPVSHAEIQIADDNTLTYGIFDECGLRFGRIPGEGLEDWYPAVVKRIQDCEGPDSITTNRPRKILGWLGLNKPVAVVNCGAFSKDELLAAVTNDSLVAGVNN